MKRVTHAVELLQLKRCLVLCHIQNGGYCVRIVRCELRINPICHAQQLACTTNIGHIGSSLVGENREIIDPFDLGKLYLCVPICALHQADHNFAIKLA